jgi:hypothetical protein
MGTHLFLLILCVPWQDGPDANCGNPITTSFLRYAEEGKLRSQFSYAKDALTASMASSYWVSASRRILSQFVVWEDMVPKEKMLEGVSSMVLSAQSEQKLGIILPQLVTAGTVTRRAVEATWLTASNPKKNRIGSELKSRVSAPPGMCFVGADVDSEELWIASLLGDSAFAKSHGSTALGWMTLLGSKNAGTDMHSRTGKTLGISRDQAKVVNYGVYGGAPRPLKIGSILITIFFFLQLAFTGLASSSRRSFCSSSIPKSPWRTLSSGRMRFFCAISLLHYHSSHARCLFAHADSHGGIAGRPKAGVHWRIKHLFGVAAPSLSCLPDLKVLPGRTPPRPPFYTASLAAACSRDI